MIKQALLAIALMAPLGLSAVANAGPSAFYPPAKSYTPGNGPYAQYAPTTHSDGSQCRYQGGPKSPIWHQHVR